MSRGKGSNRSKQKEATLGFGNSILTAVDMAQKYTIEVCYGI